MRSILILLMLALGAANPAAAHQHRAYTFSHVNANIVRGTASVSRPTREAHATKGVPSEFSELPPWW
jgi:hypothetical protein